MGRKPKLTAHQRQEALARREEGEALDAALRQAAGQAFYNTSPFNLRDLRNRASQALISWRPARCPWRRP
jgi:hypothetical protein